MRLLIRADIVSDREGSITRNGKDADQINLCTDLVFCCRNEGPGWLRVADSVKFIDEFAAGLTGMPEVLRLAVCDERTNEVFTRHPTKVG
ncbi:hypothetical protein [Citrobacter rodentium]|uniref:hypothetical protein n=1 Tax=Citrobacter rodentium TaxID=67825 RepID=UPI001391CA3A|nr:hypothetical protein [Citrobacter rodentium]UHO32721.1 hypothetical protein K7R23_08825 [Citrobacter rodentium NBRC 105723 = DSM 16636]